jgi:hypothetical protein
LVPVWLVVIWRTSSSVALKGNARAPVARATAPIAMEVRETILPDESLREVKLWMLEDC